MEEEVYIFGSGSPVHSAVLITVLYVHFVRNRSLSLGNPHSDTAWSSNSNTTSARSVCVTDDLHNRFTVDLLALTAAALFS